MRLIPPSEWEPKIHRTYVQTPRQRKVFGLLRHYLPFFNMDVVYENHRLRQAIGADAMSMPLLTEYIGELLHLVSVDEAIIQAEDA